MFVFLFNCEAVQAEDMYYGFGMGAGGRLHYSKNSLQVTPGPVVTVSFSPGDPLEFRVRSHAGAFLGYNILLSGEVIYLFPFGFWRPGIGGSLSVSFGSLLFHTDSRDYIYPSFPEYGGGILILPAQFKWGSFQLSFLETAVGTDLALLGQVLLLDLDLFQVTVNF